MECPNCITPWKCNGPHLLKISEIHYKSIDGYYIKNQKWFFIPFEKYFDEKLLIKISDTLNFLNSIS
jgi:hypothetical protein